MRMNNSDRLKVIAYADSIADATTSLEETATSDTVAEVLDALEKADTALWTLAEKIIDEEER